MRIDIEDFQVQSRRGNEFQAVLVLGHGVRSASELAFEKTELSSNRTFPCSDASHAQPLRNYVTTYSSHPNQLKYNGKVFVSTFSGSSCNFGQGSAIDGWKSQFLNQLTGDNSVYFVPAFLIDPATFPQYDSIMNGAFNVRLIPKNRPRRYSWLIKNTGSVERRVAD
jgi:hypothetical protein